MSALTVSQLNASHGQLQAVHSVSLQLHSGKMLFLLGANGAGKTTLLRSIAGDHPSDCSTVLLNGEDISQLPAHRRARAGLALVPEGRRLFPQMSVRENLALGRCTGRTGTWDIDAVYAAFPNLVKLDGAAAGKLSGGEQQAVAIGRTLMGNPAVLMLDEVSLGLSPAAVELAYQTLQTLRDSGLALLVVEQDVARALRSADQLTVLCEGRSALHTTPDDTDTDNLIAACFGQPMERAG